MNLQLIATSTTGLEAVVSNELKKLGYAPRNSDFGVGRTRFEGDFADLARANVWLRSAGKVLIQLAEFDVSNDFDVIFDAVRAIEWENWAPRDARFVVDGRSVRSTIGSVPALQRTVKKAIVDRLSGVWGLNTLPETGPTYNVEISLLKDRATLTLDSTGRGLHRRGYRLFNVAAPLRETLASALVQLSVWRPGRPLVDPFCGSGTIPIEAALIGRNIAPGMNRTFVAQGWPVISPKIWEEAREEARAAVLPPLDVKLCGYDVDPKAIEIARKHAELAGVDEDVVFNARDFQNLTDDREYGCVVTNPPYGERIGELARLRPLYESIPAVLSRLPTWSHYVVTSWLDFEKTIGQEATRRRKLFNSRIECVYYQFLGPKPPKAPTENADFDASQPSQPSQQLQTPQAFQTSRTSSTTQAAQTAQIDVPVESFQAADVASTRETPRTSQLSPTPQTVSIASTAQTPVFAGLDEYADRQAVEFGRCLTNRARHLRRYPARGITCYRLYDKDLPEVPLAIDVFEGKYLHIAEYERPDGRNAGQHRLWLDKMVAQAATILGIDSENVFLKRRSRQRGESQYEKLAESGRVVRVREGGLTFLCNMTDYLDVGLFLDHRLTREMVRKESNGKRFLNLFCYSGAFTCYALDGGATAAVSVDLSPTYLDWAEANLDENDLLPKFRGGEKAVKFVKSDVLRFLRAIPASSDQNPDIVRLIEQTASELSGVRERRDRRRGDDLRNRDRLSGARFDGGFGNDARSGCASASAFSASRRERGGLPVEFPFGIDRSDFDLCVCDPPTFSNSKSTDSDWDVQRRHVELLRLLSTRMKTGGIVYFSNNYRRFKLDEENLSDLYEIREISNRTVPEEFRNKKIHRCWRMKTK